MYDRDFSKPSVEYSLPQFSDDLDKDLTALLDYLSSLFPLTYSFINIDINRLSMYRKTLSHPVFSNCNVLSFNGQNPKTRDIKTVLRAIPSATGLIVKAEWRVGVNELLDRKHLVLRDAYWIRLRQILEMSCESIWIIRAPSLTCADLNVFFHNWLDNNGNPNLRYLVVVLNSMRKRELFKDLPLLEFDETRRRRPVYYATRGEGFPTVLLRCKPKSQEEDFVYQLEIAPKLHIYNCDHVFDIRRSDGVLATIAVTEIIVHFLVWP